MTTIPPSDADADANSKSGPITGKIPTDFQLLLERYASRIAVVSGDSTGKKVWLAAPDGYWRQLDYRPNTDAGTVLKMYINAARKEWLEQQANDDDPPRLRALNLAAVAQDAHTLVVSNPNEWATNIPTLSHDQFNSPQYIPLDTGNVLDLQTGNEYSGNDIIPLLLTPVDGGGMHNDHALANKPPQAALPLIQHFGKKVIDRLAYNFAFAPGKEIDVLVSEPANSGKDMLTIWMERAAPGLVYTDAAAQFLRPQSSRFTALERALCEHRIVIANEAGNDKQVEWPATLLTRITANQLTDEQKGKAAIQRRRRGNLILLGNANPNIEIAPGIDHRIIWAYTDGWAELPNRSGLYRLADQNADAARWLSAYLLWKGHRLLAGLDTPDWTPGEQQAREVLNNARPPEVLALADAGITAGGKDDFVTATDVRKAIADAGIELNAKANLGRWVRQLAPNAEYKQRYPSGLPKQWAYTHAKMLHSA